MEVILIFNGLGNQMSQYAFFLAKNKINKRCICIYYPSSFDNQHNGYELQNVFDIKLENKLKHKISKLIYWFYTKKDKKGIKSKIIRRSLFYLKINVIMEDLDSYEFQNEKLQHLSNGYSFFWGGWHNEKYFASIKNDLKEIFSFQNVNKDLSLQQLSEEINNKNSVSIHIRRGDYYSKNLENNFGNICTKDYYKNAISYIIEKIDNPYFYIFTDDKEWVKENFDIKNSNLIEMNSGNNSWKDMYLMSQCKHNINANSTFSWWAAWLNANENKIIIVPKKFNSNVKSIAIYPDSWIKIGSI